MEFTAAEDGNRKLIHEVYKYVFQHHGNAKKDAEEKARQK